MNIHIHIRPNIRIFNIRMRALTVTQSVESWDWTVLAHSADKLWDLHVEFANTVPDLLGHSASRSWSAPTNFASKSWTVGGSFSCGLVLQSQEASWGVI